jgi:hypothetical protein
MRTILILASVVGMAVIIAAIVTTGCKDVPPNDPNKNAPAYQPIIAPLTNNPPAPLAPTGPLPQNNLATNTNLPPNVPYPPNVAPPPTNRPAMNSSPPP